MALKTAICPHDASVVKERELLTKMQEDLVLATERRATLEVDVQYAGFWVEGFGKKGIRSMVLDRVANYLTGRANEYAEILTDEERAREQLRSTDQAAAVPSAPPNLVRVEDVGRGGAGQAGS